MLNHIIGKGNGSKGIQETKGPKEKRNSKAKKNTYKLEMNMAEYWGMYLPIRRKRND